MQSKTLASVDCYEATLVSFETLLDYVDLFAVHGLNTEEHLDWLFNHGDKGNLIDAVKELKAEGKIRSGIGFSTHAPTHVIKKAIETDAFDYLNCESLLFCFFI